MAPRVKEAIPPALGRITLVLPDGTIIQPPGLGPLDLKLPDGTYIEGSTFTPLSVQELFAFNKLKADRDIVLEAVKQEATGLEYRERGFVGHLQVARKRRRSYSASLVRQLAEANGL